MDPSRIAVVTGANRGIGLEIARQLAKSGWHVVLTSRDADKGRQAAARLRELDLAVDALQLDVTDRASCQAAHGWLAQRFERIDALINNAGILIDPKGVSVLDLPGEVLLQTLETNLFGALNVTQALAPLLRASRGARVVNVSSGMGQLAEMQSGSPAYRISKTALNALTRTLAVELAPQGIKVNTMCPGWVRTDMGGAGATRSVEQGADTAVWLATLPDDGPTGGFFRDRQPIPW
jgi:NAD(P)-dependent dehydrogenase (short-subunit alcohol dehydrogenase family)